MIYGMTIILGRLINFVVTPIITNSIEPYSYGIFSNLYSYIAVFQIILTFGLETGFFRFVNDKIDKEKVYANVQLFVIILSVAFCGLVLYFSYPLSSALGYPEHFLLVRFIGVILALDAISSIALAKLRQEDRALKFAIVNIVSICIYVGGVFLVLVVIPANIKDPVFEAQFSDNDKLRWIIIANLVQAVVKFLLLSGQITNIKQWVNKDFMFRMLNYSFPIMIVQFLGAVNNFMEKILMPFLLKGDNRFEELGIYGANFKMMVFITLFIQMFRYAADPFFFSNKNETNAKEIYASVMKYFVITGLMVILVVVGYIDVFKYFIGSNYWEGLYIVPFLLFGGLFTGIYYNLSFWFKLTDNTRYGILITLISSSVFILMNVILVPLIGYPGAAIAMLVSNIVMAVTCWLFGRKKYPVKYQWQRIFTYLVFAVVSVIIMQVVPIQNKVFMFVFNTLFILLFGAMIIWFERKELSNLIRRNES